LTRSGLLLRYSCCATHLSLLFSKDGMVEILVSLEGERYIPKRALHS
jgi:hypothetical protein